MKVRRCQRKEMQMEWTLKMIESKIEEMRESGHSMWRKSKGKETQMIEDNVNMTGWKYKDKEKQWYGKTTEQTCTDNEKQSEGNAYVRQNN